MLLSLVAAAAFAVFVPAAASDRTGVPVADVPPGQHLLVVEGREVADGTKPPDPTAEAALYRLGDLVVERPWSRATARGMRTGGGYMTIRNDGLDADRLVAVTSDVAGRAALHTHLMEDGIMRMRPVAGGIAVPPGGTVELKPGGLHVMFMGLAAPLDEGARFPVTLTFENAGDITVDLEVLAAGATDPGMRHDP